MKEVWKNIPGYPKQYYASNLGRIKSVDHVYKRKTSGNLLVKGRVLKQGHNKKVGAFYVVVNLKLQLAHRIIAKAFHIKIKNKLEVNHIDGNRKNNKASNLEWVTRSENHLHAFKLGLKSHIGIKNPKTILTPKQVLEIRNKYIPRIYTSIRLAKEYSVSRSAIKHIVDNESWTHI